MSLSSDGRAHHGARRAFVIVVGLGVAALGACGIREHNLKPAAGLPPGAPWPVEEPGTPPLGGGGGSGGVAAVPGNTGGASGRGGAPRDARPGDGGQGGSMSPPPPDMAPPAPAVPGVDLGGVRIPRERAVVIIHFGHSNMQGHGSEPLELRPHFFDTDPRLWSYRGAGRFVPAREPTANPRGNDEAGPGMAILRAVAARAPADYHFISVGLGVGSSTTQDWSKGGLYYDDFVARAKELIGRATFGAAVIMLGITDRHLPSGEQGGFADRLVKIASDLRADLGEPALPILHTDYEVESIGELAVDGPVGRLFRPLIQSLPMRIQRFAIVPTDMTGMEDDHHFNLAGQKLFGDRCGQILADKAWTRWPVR